VPAFENIKTALDQIATFAKGLEGRPDPPIFFPLAGQFLLDPGEFNGWGVIGPYDNLNTQDLGNVGAGESRLSGGICYPFDVRMIRLFAWHRNNNGAALAWGWHIVRQKKNAGSNSVTNVPLLSEVADNGGVAPRDYLNTVTQNTDVDLSSASIVPAGETIVLGVESPTAITTNRYVQVMSGFLQMERV